MAKKSYWKSPGFGVALGGIGVAALWWWSTRKPVATAAPIQADAPVSRATVEKQLAAAQLLVTRLAATVITAMNDIADVDAIPMRSRSEVQNQARARAETAKATADVALLKARIEVQRLEALLGSGNLGALSAGAFRGQVGSVVQLGSLARLPPFDNSLPYFQVGKTTVGYRRGGTRTVQLPHGRQVVMRDRRG